MGPVKLAGAVQVTRPASQRLPMNDPTCSVVVPVGVTGPVSADAGQPAPAGRRSGRRNDAGTAPAQWLAHSSYVA
jgi:hypothetical protein